MDQSSGSIVSELVLVLLQLDYLIFNIQLFIVFLYNPFYIKIDSNVPCFINDISNLSVLCVFFLTVLKVFNHVDLSKQTFGFVDFFLLFFSLCFFHLNPYYFLFFSFGFSLFFSYSNLSRQKVRLLI